MADEFLIIDPEDFKTMRLEVDFANITTKTEIRDGKRILGGIQDSASGMLVEVVEFEEAGVVVDTPARSGAQGHQLLLKLRLVAPKSKVEFSATGNVVGAEDMDGRQRLRVQFTEFVRSEWKALMDVYAQRQEAITEFLSGQKT